MRKGTREGMGKEGGGIRSEEGVGVWRGGGGRGESKRKGCFTIERSLCLLTCLMPQSLLP